MFFPVNAENPARVDFFGDGVEKIKPYNFVTGERLAQAEFLDIVAATDVTINEGEVSEIKDVLFDELSRIRDARAYERAQTIVGELCAKLEAGASFAGASFFLPLLGLRVDFSIFWAKTRSSYMTRANSCTISWRRSTRSTRSGWQI